MEIAIGRLRATEHFPERELRCHCGDCEYPGMSAAFMRVIEGIRREYDKPLYPTSAYRCPSYNQKVSHTGPDGPHTLAVAIDFRVFGQDAHRLIGIAYDFGIPRIGIKQKGDHRDRFVHFDMAPETPTRPSLWVWTY